MTDSDFTLHKQLAANSVFITDLLLSRVQLINDSHYPWVILVPRRHGATEIFKLHADDQATLWAESSMLCKVMENLFQPDKMNVAAIGNMVPQLHLHHVARFKSDVAWPAPVWGFTQPAPYDPDTLEQRVSSIKEELQLHIHQNPPHNHSLG